MQASTPPGRSTAQCCARSAPQAHTASGGSTLRRAPRVPPRTRGRGCFPTALASLESTRPRGRARAAPAGRTRTGWASRRARRAQTVHTPTRSGPRRPTRAPRAPQTWAPPPPRRPRQTATASGGTRAPPEGPARRAPRGATRPQTTLCLRARRARPGPTRQRWGRLRRPCAPRAPRGPTQRQGPRQRRRARATRGTPTTPCQTSRGCAGRRATLASRAHSARRGRTRLRRGAGSACRARWGPTRRALGR
mmetsp:Transcript_36062/g.84423  ORF Transcript_36062/g.84423 Transcript_36062/m.84423 type:complete len:250 (-) Transcript_36062:151-900(-)